MTRSKWSLTKRTRDLAGDAALEQAYGGLLSVMFVLAGIADDVEQRASDRRLASVEWWLKWSELDAAIGKAAREESWASRRPRAV